MPLYMDIHIVDSGTFSVEDVVTAHMEDLAIQERFGVTQLKYWVNVEANTIFCLMEGPSVEACNNVHKHAHGNTACNIVEVSEDEFNLYMGVGKSVNDLAHTEAGEIDTGYRTILLVNIVQLSREYDQHIETLIKIVESNEGVLIPEVGNGIMVSFIFAANAIHCALAISNLLDSIPEQVDYNMALSSGRPLDEKGESLFEVTKRKVQCLCSVGCSKKIFLASETKALLAKSENSINKYSGAFSVVHTEEYNFLQNLFENLSLRIGNSHFKSSELPGILGLSKSQAYRRISSLTGMSLNQLLQEIRLRKSIELLNQKSRTISQISYEVGFNSPTYFTRAFKSRYSLTPSNISKRYLM